MPNVIRGCFSGFLSNNGVVVRELQKLFASVANGKLLLGVLSIYNVDVDLSAVFSISF